MNPTRVADLTVDELIAIVKQAVREVNTEANGQLVVAIEPNIPTTPVDHTKLLDLPPLSLGGLRPGAPAFISREDFYDDNDPDGR